MRLSDVVSAIDLTLYPQIGLAIFLTIFVAVTIRAMRTSRSDHSQHAAIPFTAEEPATMQEPPETECLP